MADSDQPRTGAEPETPATSNEPAAAPASDDTDDSEGDTPSSPEASPESSEG